MVKKILIIDNYDSFTYNLVHYIEAGEVFEADVFRSKEINSCIAEKYQKIIFSPGPGLPSDYPIMFEILEKYQDSKDILGVCLGHQAIASFYKAELFNMQKVFHGKKRKVILNGVKDEIFEGLPRQFMVGRYHSWAVNLDEANCPLQVTSIDEEGSIMSFKHKNHNIRGLQYHPESILTEYGKNIIDNWLKL